MCKASVFTLTTDNNNGALPCECNIDGSLSFNCETYSGQCSCRDNVIGRDCSECKTGYYGFPRCQRKFLPWSVLLNNWKPIELVSNEQQLNML